MLTFNRSIERNDDDDDDSLFQLIGGGGDRVERRDVLKVTSHRKITENCFNIFSLSRLRVPGIDTFRALSHGALSLVHIIILSVSLQTEVRCRVVVVVIEFSGKIDFFLDGSCMNATKLKYFLFVFYGDLLTAVVHYPNESRLWSDPFLGGPLGGRLTSEEVPKSLYQPMTMLDRSRSSSMIWATPMNTFLPSIRL